MREAPPCQCPPEAVQQTQKIPAERVTAVRYSAEEVLRNFLALFESLDFSSEVAGFGIGRLQIQKRKKAVLELKAVVVALWRLALQRSLPKDASMFFTELLLTAPFLADGAKDGPFLQQRISTYAGLLAPKRETDFMPLAAYLVKELGLTAEDSRSLYLKISLYLRSLYQLIFTRLL